MFEVQYQDGSHLIQKSQLIGKTLILAKIEGKRKRMAEDKVVR